MSDTKVKLVVAIDFGTTFSGAAWALSTDPDELEHISMWPNHTGDNALSGKVPTRLMRVEGDTSRWGFLIPRDAPLHQVFRCFKLKLDARPEAAGIASPEALQDFSDAQVDGLVLEYLEPLVSYLKQQLLDRIGHVLLATYDTHYVMTVPAIWTARATQRTKRAFELALGSVLASPVLDVSEPEAAANCVLQRDKLQLIRANESFMILDAGGGTVDLISYVLREEYPVRVNEVVAGSGDFCGGATVTNRFEEWLWARMGGAENLGGEEVPEIIRVAVEAFDSEIKPGVTSAALVNNRFSITMEGFDDRAEIGLRNERLELAAADIVTFFQPSIERVKLLVAQQIAAAKVPITAIFMVGGYGQSIYLREELEAEPLIQQRGIRIHQPADAWTAVVEGAVMSGLSRVAPRPGKGMTVGYRRKARRHSGTELVSPYYESVHAGLVHKRRWDGLQGAWEVDLMKWFIQKGDDVKESRPYTTHFHVINRVNFGKPKMIFLIIYEDEASEVAPMARNDNVRQLCVVEADLGPIPENQIPQRRGADGFMYYFLSAKIEGIYNGLSANYTLIFNGQRYNTVTAEFAD